MQQSLPRPQEECVEWEVADLLGLKPSNNLLKRPLAFHLGFHFSKNLLQMCKVSLVDLFENEGIIKNMI